MLRKRLRPELIDGAIDFNGFTLAMTNVVFVLLVIMMLTPAPHHGVSIDLPRASNPVDMLRANREDAMIIGVTRDGKVYLRSDRADPAELPALIHESLAAGAEQKAYLKIDQRAKYGVVTTVLANVHSAGVQKVGLLVEKRFQPAPVPSP